MFAPHTRGSTSAKDFQILLSRFAPHTRGSTLLALAIEGMAIQGLPRTRGGLPLADFTIPSVEAFAPHTRGSTVIPGVALLHPCVCPAHAGVYRYTAWPLVHNERLPRTRGGLPQVFALLTNGHSFAPHTRGSTENLDLAVKHGYVCPAHAGVYRIHLASKT